MLLGEIASLQLISRTIPNIRDNYWLNKNENFNWSEKNQSEVINNAREMIDTVSKINELILRCNKTFPNCRIDLTNEVLPNVNNVNEELNYCILSELASNKSFLKIIASLLISINEMSKSLNYFNMFKSSANLQQMQELDEYFCKKRNFLKWFTPTYWKMKKRLEDITNVPIEKLLQNRELNQWIKFEEKRLEVTKALSNIGFTGIINLDFSKAESLLSLEENFIMSQCLSKNLAKLYRDGHEAYLESVNNSHLVQNYNSYLSSLEGIKVLFAKLCSILEFFKKILSRC